MSGSHDLLSPITRTGELYRWCKHNNVVAKFTREGVTVLSLDDPTQRKFSAGSLQEAVNLLRLRIEGDRIARKNRERAGKPDED